MSFPLPHTLRLKKAQIHECFAVHLHRLTHGCRHMVSGQKAFKRLRSQRRSRYHIRLPIEKWNLLHRLLSKLRHQGIVGIRNIFADHIYKIFILVFAEQKTSRQTKTLTGLFQYRLDQLSKGIVRFQHPHHLRHSFGTMQFLLNCFLRLHAFAHCLLCNELTEFDCKKLLGEHLQKFYGTIETILRRAHDIRWKLIPLSQLFL